MNRKELLRHLLSHAQSNGFDFRGWFHDPLQISWTGAEQALTLLTMGGRYYALLFSHEFARILLADRRAHHFHCSVDHLPRINRQGEVIQVTRKPFTRRTVKPDVWKYHLRQMAATEDPMTISDGF